MKQLISAWILLIALFITVVPQITICPFGNCPQTINPCEFQVGGRCIQCISGYIISNGQCVEYFDPIENCAVQNRDICTECIDGYAPLSNVCTSLSLIDCDENIQVCPAQTFGTETAFEEFILKREKNSEPGQPPKVTPTPQPDQFFFKEADNQNTVEEAEIIRTDGRYIYTFYRNTLSVFQGYPTDEATLLSTIQIKFSVEGMFVREDRICVFGTLTKSTTSNGIQPRLHILVIDVKDRRNPTIISNFEMSGKYFNGRMTPDGYVYLLTTAALTAINIPSFEIDGSQFNLPIEHLYIYDPKINYFSGIFLTVFAFSIEDLVSGIGVASLITKDSRIVYMSEEAIYVSYPVNFGEETVIHKVFVQRSKIVPLADTKIEGNVNNQFSMDEYDNVLRVATSNVLFGTNYVYTLDYNLKELDKSSSFADFKRIFAVRFTTNRLYISTFQRTDPFYVIDVSNPNSIQILGNLVLEGFSRFLYVFVDNIILSFGRADGQRNAAPQLTLFNVEDPTNPKINANITIASGNEKLLSSAEFDHKALLISKTKNLVSLPLRNKNFGFNGAFMFYVDRNFIELKEGGQINHLPSSYDKFNDYTVQRSFIVEQMLYTKSKCKIQINRIYNGDFIKQLELPNCP